MVMTGVGVPSRTPPADPVSAPAMRRAQALGRSAKSKTHPLTSLADTEIVVAHRESMEPDIALSMTRTDARLTTSKAGGL
jgi:hypothetical protein